MHMHLIKKVVFFLPWLFKIEECKATKYITGSGPGSKRYINEDDFKNAGIELEWQDYKPKEYKQLNGEFIPYMNVLDLLFNNGPYSKQYL